MKQASGIRRILEAGFCLLGSMVAAPAFAGSVMVDPTRNPWALPLAYCAAHPGAYDVDINMGFVNTDYACQISAAHGVQFDKQTRQSTDHDAARWVLNAVNRCQDTRQFRLQTGVSRDSLAELQALLPAVPHADIRIGRQDGYWSPPETHAKVFQLADPAAERYFTVHGSLNLQTVGLCCKANNTLRFVEQGAGPLHGYFKQLADAVAVNSAEGLFDGRGSAQSSGLVPEVAIGDYRVAFYAGRAQAFVGVHDADSALPWPRYLNPPVAGHHAPGIVHWYDGVLYEAARQLQQGRAVHLDVLMFEIGSESAFVNHLWRFVQEGFAGGIPVDGDGVVDAPIKGLLQVRFLWQFQSHPKPDGETTRNLNSGTAIDTSGAQGGYHLRSGRIWPRFDAHGEIVPPTTPEDMHNKVVLMSVPNHAHENRIFVASSNLDMPGVGSGRLWQAGTVVRSVQAPPPEAAGRPGSVFQAYQNYFDRLWRNRQGQPAAGQVPFYEEQAFLHRAGRVNWIETPVTDAFGETTVKPGIDAFFFPVPADTP